MWANDIAWHSSGKSFETLHVSQTMFLEAKEDVRSRRVASRPDNVVGSTLGTRRSRLTRENFLLGTGRQLVSTSRDG